MTTQSTQPTRPADLLYSDVETDLRASVRDLLTDRCDPESVLARIETGQPCDLKLWRTLAADLGVAGLQVPEELGGHGASVRESAVVLEELGRSVAPVPFLSSAVLATTTLLAADTSRDEVAAPLARLAAGEQVSVLAVALSTWPGADFPVGVRADGDGVLTGRVSSVADATAADLLLVPATGRDGAGIYAVDPRAGGVTVTPRVSLDPTRQVADVAFDGTRARALVAGEQAVVALSTALRTGAGLLASEQLGVAQWCLDETVSYVKQRFQFGRAVGSFQALKHRLADLYLQLVSARAAARYAADVLASDNPDVGVAVALAQSYCSDVAVRAAEECVQLHGGIGMTWEHPAHLYLKRAKADQLALGTPGRHRSTLGGLVSLPA
jgi:alkylation response protein AidB-like acyl-CoA dehydrogenase